MHTSHAPSLHPGIERPEISKPVKPAATATKVAFELYKEAKEEYSKYKAGTETLKSYLMDAKLRSWEQ